MKYVFQDQQYNSTNDVIRAVQAVKGYFKLPSSDEDWQALGVTYIPDDVSAMEKEIKDAKAAEIRMQRDQLLRESDFAMSVTDVSFSEEQQAEIRAYRKALRDVPEQPTFPDQVTWPQKPDCL